MERRLAAILVADVAGFSRLAAADEEGTLADLERLRRDVVLPAIADHGGHVFKTTGDGLLASFPSVVEAIRCAVRIQSVPRGEPSDQGLVLRIGVHLGDVVVEGDDLMGDGVNIAARLEQLARPGGVCLSGAVHEQVRDRLPQFTFRDGGEQSLRNMDRPLHLWHLDATHAVEAIAPSAAQTPSAIPVATRQATGDRPSLAVLPFVNLSGDPGQDYFSDGITEEIITALSRFKSLIVIARSASFAMREHAGDLERLGAELGAEFLLQGSIRRSGERVRVTAQLVAAASGAQMWAERFDRTLADLLDVQDEIAGHIVGAVAPQIRAAEIERARRPGLVFSRSYDIALQAHALSAEARRRSDRALLQQALDLAREAARTEPVSPRAFHTLALTSLRVADLASFSPEEVPRALEDARVAAERLAEMQPDDHSAYLLLGNIAIMQHRSDEARRLFQRAHDLNPNDPVVTQMLAWAECNEGLGEQAAAHAQDALLRSPLGSDRRAALWTLAMAHWVAGDPAAGLAYARESIAGQTGFVQRYGVLVACLVELGEIDEAGRLLAHAEQVAPGYVKSRLEGKNWFVRPELGARYASAFRKAAGLDPA